MLNGKPLVSVIMVYFNDEKFIYDAISSVLKQSWVNIEVILINHASEDNSRRIAHSFEDKRLIHVDMEYNIGASGGILLKKGLSLAKGEYIRLFGADDIMEEKCIEDLMLFSESESSDIAFSDMSYINEKGSQLPGLWSTTRDYFSFNYNSCELLDLYVQGISVLPFASVLMKKTVLESLKIDETLIYMFDMTLWVQALLQGRKFCFFRHSTVRYRIHDGQTSAKSKLKIISTACMYEAVSYFAYFFEAHPKWYALHVAQKMMKNADKIEVEKISPSVYSFLICLYAFKLGYESIKISSYVQLKRIVENEEHLAEINEVYAFSIREFRELYKKNGQIFQQKEHDVDVSFLKKIFRNIEMAMQIFYNRPVKQLRFYEIACIFIMRPVFCIYARVKKQANAKSKQLNA